jgi:hypothetical protein
MTVEDLLRAIRGGDDEAALTLGLLLERGSRGPDDDDDDIAQSLPPELAERHLTAAEREAGIDGLIAYVEGEPAPIARAVWALSKSYDQRAAPALRGVLERTMDAPEHEHLAYQALTGLIPVGGDDLQAAVRDAAERGHGEVRDTARRYLRINAGP